MEVAYYALVPMQVGDEWRQPGDLIPEANTWPHLNSYVAQHQIAPVLVATLPAASRNMLDEWTQDRDKDQAKVAKEQEKASKERQDREAQEALDNLNRQRALQGLHKVNAEGEQVDDEGNVLHVTFEDPPPAEDIDLAHDAEIAVEASEDKKSGKPAAKK